MGKLTPLYNINKRKRSMVCDIFSNYLQLLKKRRKTMDEWDDEFFESLVKTGRCRSSRPEVFCKKGVLRNFAKFTGRLLCQCLFFEKETF